MEIFNALTTQGCAASRMCHSDAFNETGTVLWLNAPTSLALQVMSQRSASEFKCTYLNPLEFTSPHLFPAYIRCCQFHYKKPHHIHGIVQRAMLSSFRRAAFFFALFSYLSTSSLVAHALTAKRRAVSKDVIIQMFQWNWDSIAAECTNFIGPAGYGFVQGEILPSRNLIYWDATGTLPYY